jgi:hypothetical protein
MDYLVTTYRCADFDGRIYVKITSRSNFKSARVLLLKDGGITAEKKTTDRFVMFKENDIGVYKAIVELTLNDDSLLTLESNTTSVVTQALIATANPYPAVQNVKGTQQLCEGVHRHYLELKLQKDCLERLKAEPADMLVKSYDLVCNAPLNKVSLKAYWQDEEDLEVDEQACDRYIIEQDIPEDQIIALAQELEKLDYVIYCTVTPDTKNMAPPELPVPEPGDIVAGELVAGPVTASATASFTHRQTYMNAGMGMNIAAVRANGELGQRATVRIMDAGVNPEHEDLSGNITVVNTRPLEDGSHHGTATTGCIAAANNTFGMTGIASGCSCYFYDTGDLDKVMQEAEPGDLLTLSFGFRYPLIHSLSWWERFKVLSERGVTVLMAAGNSSDDLRPGRSNMNQYGDSGAILVGACYHNTGRRVGFSSHSHSTSLMNSWGDWSVATTGYGRLFNGGPNRTYTATYSGTSSATPLCCGALALIQSHAIGSQGRCLTPVRFRELIRTTGYRQADGQGIGRRPDVRSAIRSLDQEVDVPERNPSPEADLYRINTAGQLTRAGNDAAGNYLRESLLAFRTVEIATRNGVWTSTIAFPSPQLVPQDRTITFSSQATFDTTLIINGANFVMPTGSSTRFVIINGLWRPGLIYQINGAAQFTRLANDTAGAYLREQLQRFTRVEIFARNGAHANRIVFPRAEQILPGREILVDTEADWQIRLEVNGNTFALHQGSSQRFVVINNTWRLVNGYVANSSAQLNQLGNDTAGNLLRDRLRTFEAVEIGSQNGIWTSRIVFPDAAAVAAGRVILFTARADWDTVLVVNGANHLMRNGEAIRFFVANNRWRQ